MPGIPDGLNYNEFKNAVKMAIVELQRESASPLGGVGSDGAESLATSAGMISVPRRRDDWIVACIATDRQLSGGGSESDPASPGEDVEYKVKVLDTGVESGWLTPVRSFDEATIGYTLAAVNSHGLLVRFPKSDGSGEFDVYLVLISDPEQVLGAPCA